MGLFDKWVAGQPAAPSTPSSGGLFDRWLSGVEEQEEHIRSGAGIQFTTPPPPITLPSLAELNKVTPADVPAATRIKDARSNWIAEQEARRAPVVPTRPAAPTPPSLSALNRVEPIKTPSLAELNKVTQADLPGSTRIKQGRVQVIADQEARRNGTPIRPGALAIGAGSALAEGAVSTGTGAVTFGDAFMNRIRTLPVEMTAKMTSGPLQLTDRGRAQAESAIARENERGQATRAEVRAWGDQATQGIRDLTGVDPTKMGTVGRVLHGSVSSLPQMLAGTPVFLTSAIGNYIAEAEGDGATAEDAWAYGVLSGATEMGLERVLGVVPGLKGLKDAAGAGLRGVLKNAAGEALEEGLTTHLTTGFKKLTYAPDATVAQLYGQEGKSGWQLALAIAGQTGEDAASGAVMALLVTALGLPGASRARKLAERAVESGTEITPAQAQEIAQAVDEVAPVEAPVEGADVAAPVEAPAPVVEAPAPAAPPVVEAPAPVAPLAPEITAAQRNAARDIFSKIERGLMPGVEATRYSMLDGLPYLETTGTMTNGKPYATGYPLGHGNGVAVNMLVTPPQTSTEWTPVSVRVPETPETPPVKLTPPPVAPPPVAAPVEAPIPKGFYNPNTPPIRSPRPAGGDPTALTTIMEGEAGSAHISKYRPDLTIEFKAMPSLEVQKFLKQDGWILDSGAAAWKKDSEAARATAQRLLGITPAPAPVATPVETPVAAPAPKAAPATAWTPITQLPKGHVIDSPIYEWGRSVKATDIDGDRLDTGLGQSPGTAVRLYNSAMHEAYGLAIKGSQTRTVHPAVADALSWYKQVYLRVQDTMVDAMAKLRSGVYTEAQYKQEIGSTRRQLANAKTKIKHAAAGTSKAPVEVPAAPVAAPPISTATMKPTDALTGKPFSSKVYQGRGKSRAEIYGKVPYPILGEGSYYAFDTKNAHEYGDSITETDVLLKNPIVINDDSQWRSLTKKYGVPSDLADMFFRLQGEGKSEEDARVAVIAEIDKLHDALIADGYDGAVLSFDSHGDVNPRTGGGINSLYNLFGHDQVIRFAPTKTASVEAPTPVATRTPAKKTPAPVKPAGNDAPVETPIEMGDAHIEKKLSPNGKRLVEVIKKVGDVDQLMKDLYFPKSDRPGVEFRARYNAVRELLEGLGGGREYTRISLAENHRMEIRNTVPAVAEMLDRLGVKSAPPKKGSRASGDVQSDPIQKFVDEFHLMPAGDDSSTEALPVDDLVARIEEVLGIPVRTGKFRQHAHGIYKVKSEVVRVKIRNNLPTIYHEVGHHLDKLHKIRTDPALNAELLKLGQPKSAPSYTPDRIKGEGVAEFVRWYLTDPPVLQQLAPKTLAAIEGKISKDEMALLTWLRTQTAAIVNLPANKRILNDISTYENHTSVVDARTPWYSKFYRNWVNERGPFKFMKDSELRKIQKANKGITPISEWVRYLASAGLDARTSVHNGLDAKIVNAFTDAQLDINNQEIGPSLETILSPISRKEVQKRKGNPKQEWNDFLVYMVSRRAADYKTRNLVLPQPMATYEDALAILDAKYPHFDSVFTALRTYENNDLQMLVDAGLLSKDGMQKIKDANPNHAPLMRIREGLETIANGAGKHLGSSKKVIKQARGGGATIIDPIESIINNAFILRRAAESNVILQELAKLATQFDGMGDMIEKVPPGMKKTQFAVEDIQRQLYKIADANGETDLAESIRDMSEETLDAMLAIFRPSFSEKPGEITIYTDGKPHLYEVNTGLYKAIKGLNKQSSHFIIRALNVPKRVLQTGAVTTIQFVLKNIGRDVTTSFIQSEAGINYIDIFNGYASAAKKDKWLREFLREGGGTEFLAVGSRAQNQLIEDQLRGTSIKERVDRIWGAMAELKRNPNARTRQKLGSAVVALMGAPMRGIRSLLEFSESGPRVAEYIKNIEAGKSTLLSATRARNLSQDFVDAGTMAREVNKVSAFFNAGIGGVKRMVESFTQHPVRTLVRGFISITIPQLILYFLFNRDDEDYQNLPEWRKATLYNFPLGIINPAWKGRFLSLPKPYGYGFLFGSLPELALERMREKDPDALDKLGTHFLTHFDLMPGINAIDPWLDISANRDSLSGAPIIGQGQLNEPKYLQYGPGTSMLSKGLGDLTKNMPDGLQISPKILDYLVKRTTGSVGFGLWTAPDNAHGIATGEFRATDLGLVRSFITDSVYSSAAGDNFYTAGDAITKIRGELEEGLIRPLRHVPEDQRDAATREIEKMYSEYNKVARQFSQDRALIRLLGAGAALTEGERLRIGSYGKADPDLTPREREAIAKVTGNEELTPKERADAQRVIWAAINADAAEFADAWADLRLEYNIR